jgi:DNA-directed RNA polymerase specialized sigma24 family protein
MTSHSVTSADKDRAVMLADLEGLAARCASTVIRRFRNAGSLSFTAGIEIRQVAYLAGLEALATWKPHGAASWRTYATAAMFRALSRWLRQEMKYGDTIAYGDTDRIDPDTLPDDTDMQADLEARERACSNLRALSPVTRSVVLLINEPPRVLVDGVRALQDRKRYERARARKVRYGVTYLADLMNLTGDASKRIAREVRTVSEQHA